jgi:predicted TIM-barrel fold metal-dependent hydrolase
MDEYESTMAELERVVSGGARAVFIRSSAPPFGWAPADRRVDPLWQYCESHDVAVTLHIGGDTGFINSAIWCNIPEFAPPEDYASLEFPGLDPYIGAVCHFANENFLQAMILGGVFERFPRLRFGVIETGASWVGPLAERLDDWCKVYPRQAAQVLERPPSEYLNQNVRVSPFYFEDIRSYFEKYPQVHDVYAFASDYPHVEGGKNTKVRMAEQLAPLGDDITEKFFHTNGAWLLSD